MRRVLTVVAAAASVLAVAGSTAAAPHPSFVVGAGAIQTSPNHPRIAVHAWGTGVGVAATGKLAIRTDSWWARIDARCILHTGSVVMVGGIVTETTAPAGPGWGAVVVVADRGNGPRVKDQVGYGFGPVDPSVTCTVDPGTFPLVTLTAGNFVTK